MKRIFLLSLILVLCLTMSVSAKTSINLWFAGTPQGLMELFDKKLVPQFERENPNIDLTVTFVPWGELSTKLATAFAGGVAPDVFMHGGAATAGFASSDRIEPLDSYIAGWEDADDFGATLDSGLYMGKRYTIPIFGAGRLLVYRADQFREVGLDPDNPPATWEELREAAKKLTIRKGNRLIREGLDIPSAGIDAQQIWAGLLWQNGGDFFNEDYTKAAFNSPEGVEALQFIVDLIHKEGTTDTQINEGQGNIPPIASGKVAMFFAVPGDLKTIETYSTDIYDEIRVALPMARKERATLYSFSGFFMSKDTPHKAEAWQTMKWFTSAEILAEINASMSTLPPRASMAKAEFIAKDPRLATFVEAMQFGRPNPNIPQWVKARDILSRYIEKAVYGVMSPQEALDKAAEEVNRALAE